MSELKIKFKDFKKNIHEVPVQNTASIEECKMQLCSFLANGTTQEQIKLIFSGKVLANKKNMQDYSIKTGDQIIFMVSKKKTQSPAPVVEPKVTDPILSRNAETAAPSAQSTETAEPVQAAAAPAVPAPAPATTTTTTTTTAAPAAPPTEYITRLMELGYSHEESVMALQLANNDPNRACELLLMGLTEDMVPPAAATTDSTYAVADRDGDAQMDDDDDNDNNNNNNNNNDDDDDDLFAQAAAAASTGPGASGNPASGNANGQEPRSISLTMTDLMQLRRIVNGDPESLQPFLEGMISRYPQLEDQIQRSPEMFLAMLLEGLGGNIPSELEEQLALEDATGATGAGESGADSSLAPPPPTIQLSPEENDAINRLCELGNFERNLVIQIYFACDKNEEVAANLLFMEHADN